MVNLASECHERIALARKLALAAGDLLLSYFGRLEHIERKGAVDLVTEADKAAEALIADAVAEAFPEDGFLGEEGGLSGAEEARWSWVVDPLDGTTNFVHRVPHFAVSIGLLFEGAPYAGVVRHICRHETYHAVRGEGAWCGERRLEVTSRRVLSDCLLATGFGYDRAQRADELLAPVKRALEQGRGLRRMGSAALDLVDVAQGLYDGFWEDALNPWDVAAGVVLVQEAGGQVTAFGGRPMTIDGGSFIATNGLIHEAIIALVGRD
ncbi:MAG: inositol monophosphatase family protein [Myxococcota bacterium]